MKTLQTVKGKLLGRILSVVVIGVVLIVALGGYLNYHSSFSAVETTLSELALQTSYRLKNYLNRYVAIAKELGMYEGMGYNHSVAEKLELLAKKAKIYGFDEYGYIDADGWGYEVLGEVIDYREDHC